MDRRELLRMIAIATGGVVIGGDFLLSGCKNPETKTALTFSDNDIAFLNEVAETVLPQTNSAGAKAANAGTYMSVWVNDCYTTDEQQIFHKGITALDEASKKMNGKSFMESTAEERTKLLIAIDNEKKEYYKTKKAEEPDHYFQQMKQLAIAGYFCSEKGRKEALRYTPVPGKYIGDLEYKKGDKAFAGLS